MIFDLFSLMMTLLLVFILIPFIILSFIAIWVYRDAKKKRINAAIWVIIIWIIPFFIGVIIYFIMRDKISEEVQ
ncbi:MAG: hypothetical protein ACFE9X_07385 [Promethearchaeota archaeon]